MMTDSPSSFPDFLSLSVSDQPIKGLPDFLKASYLDLSEYLAGDKVKEYPFLANIPEYQWVAVKLGDFIPVG